MNNQRNKIPSITKDRLDSNGELALKPTSIEEQKIHAFLKGKEPIQTFTARIPKKLYSQFRKIAFDKDIKMNQIIVQLIKDYVINPID